MHTDQKRKVFVYIRVEEKNRFVSATVENSVKMDLPVKQRVFMDSCSENSWVPRLTAEG